LFSAVYRGLKLSVSVVPLIVAQNIFLPQFYNLFELRYHW